MGVLEIGKAYFVRTLTHYTVGRLIAIDGQLLVFEDAAWVADTGRFSDFIKTGKAIELEPVEDVYVNMQNIIDIFPWNHLLPRERV